MQPHPYATGDRVRLTDGPFADFEAQVREVLADRLRLEVTMFGRPIPIDAEAWQVERSE